MAECASGRKIVFILRGYLSYFALKSYRAEVISAAITLRLTIRRYTLGMQVMLIFWF
jgi:hypothetical protein